MSTEPLLRFPDGLPDELLALDELELLRRLGRPTLIRQPGTGEARARAIATLLHGDESTGLQAMLRILRRRRVYPFDLYVIIGNVRAALEPPGFAVRYLDDQEDFNRIWGLGDPTTSQRRAADAILAELRAADLESLVDIHNNTGDNPFYAIITMETPEVINLATLFTTTLLRWDLELHTLMEATHDLCPSIAVECGLPGRPESLAFAVDALRRYLGAEPLATNQVLRDHDLLGGMRKVMIRPEVRFRFGGELSDDVDLVLDRDLDAHNFRDVPAGLVLGWVHPGASLPLYAIDPDGHDVTDEHFEVVGGHVVITTPGTPVMMTRTVAATRKDCLFYLATERPAPLDPVEPGDEGFGVTTAELGEARFAPDPADRGAVRFDPAADALEGGGWDGEVVARAAPSGTGRTSARSRVAGFSGRREPAGLVGPGLDGAGDGRADRDTVRDRERGPGHLGPRWPPADDVGPASDEPRDPLELDEDGLGPPADEVRTTVGLTLGGVAVAAEDELLDALVGEEDRAEELAEEPTGDRAGPAKHRAGQDG